jgi:hypothetical protein
MSRTWLKTSETQMGWVERINVVGEAAREARESLERLYVFFVGSPGIGFPAALPKKAELSVRAADE